MILTYKLYDPVLAFAGTDSEQAEIERMYEYNESLKLTAFNMVKEGRSLYAYADYRHKNGHMSRLVLHKSAKYECLQLTCLHYENDVFQYASYDCKIDSFEKFSIEFSIGEKIICA